MTPQISIPVRFNHFTFSPNFRESGKEDNDEDDDDVRLGKNALLSVVDIDQIQAEKDPHYNSAYAWQIARTKLEEEVCDHCISVTISIAYCFVF